MAEAVFLLCATAGIACASLLYRGYSRNRSRLSVWTMVFFLVFAASNILLVFDLMVIDDVDLSTLRIVLATAGALALLGGMIRETT